MILPFSVQGNSTKEKIIEILAERWPLTAKKIYKGLSKRYHLSLTYQAAYKALQELTENKILEKKKKGYLINKEWIERLNEFSEKIKMDLENAHKKRINKITEKITFEKHADFVKFHMRFLEKVVKNEGRANMIFYFRHVPYPHVITQEDLEKMKPLMPKIKWTIITKYATPLDKWCARHWKKMGVKVHTGKDIPTSTIMIIINHHVMDVSIPKKAIKEWDKIFSIRDIRYMDMHKMTQTLLDQKFKTVLTITEDEDLATMKR